MATAIPHLVALLVPDEEFAAAWARRAAAQADLAALAEDSDFQPGPRRRRSTGSMPASRAIERIRRFAIAAEPFTTENAMMTASLKIRRHKIRERYGRDAGGSLSVTCTGLPELLLQGICSYFCLLCLERRGCRTCFYREFTGVLDSGATAGSQF